MIKSYVCDALFTNSIFASKRLISRMAKELNERKIIGALSDVRMPNTGKPITDAGNVSGIVIKGGHVSFTVEIDPNDKDAAKPMYMEEAQTDINIRKSEPMSEVDPNASLFDSEALGERKNSLPPVPEDAPGLR